MKVSIQEDMWQVSCQLNESLPGQGDSLIRAIMDFGFTGEDPAPCADQWYFAYLAFRGRVELSAKQSAGGEIGAAGKWHSNARKSSTKNGSDDAQPDTQNGSDDAQPDTQNGSDDAQPDTQNGSDDAQPDTQNGSDDAQPDTQNGCFEARRNTHDAESESESESESEKKRWREKVRAASEAFVSHLNAACGTSYRADTPDTLKHVSARLKDYTVEDLCAVADGMAEEWLYDPKMKKFLRPETLLRPSKFEGYLQRVRSRAPSQQSFSEFALPADEVIVSA